MANILSEITAFISPDSISRKNKGHDKAQGGKDKETPRLLIFSKEYYSGIEWSQCGYMQNKRTDGNEYVMQIKKKLENQLNTMTKCRYGQSSQTAPQVV